MMPYTMKDMVARQVVFSQHAFGPGPRTEGLRKHIGKELDEIRDAPRDVTEWIDVIILGMDGAWRCLREQYPWMTPEELGSMVAKALHYKMDVNSQRKWPDWREAGQDKPIEHEKGHATDEIVSRETHPLVQCARCGLEHRFSEPCPHPRPGDSTYIPDDSFGNGY